MLLILPCVLYTRLVIYNLNNNFTSMKGPRLRSSCYKDA